MVHRYYEQGRLVIDWETQSNCWLSSINHLVTETHVGRKEQWVKWFNEEVETKTDQKQTRLSPCRLQLKIIKGDNNTEKRNHPYIFTIFIYSWWENPEINTQCYIHIIFFPMSAFNGVFFNVYCVYGDTWMPSCKSGGQRTTLNSQFPHATIRVTRLELRLSGLVASTLSLWATWPASLDLFICLWW